MYQNLYPKRFRIFITLSIALFVLGLAGGYYTALAIQKKIELLLPAAIVFAILTWLGSGADFMGFFRDWYREIQQEKKIPILEFGDIIVKRVRYETQGKDYEDSTYFLIINNSTSQGMAKDCHGFLYIEGTNIRRFITVWSDNNQQYIPISISRINAI